MTNCRDYSLNLKLFTCVLRLLGEGAKTSRDIQRSTPVRTQLNAVILWIVSIIIELTALLGERGNHFQLILDKKSPHFE